MFAGYLNSQFNLTLARQRMLILPLNTNPLSEILKPDPFKQIPLPLSRKVAGSGLGGYCHLVMAEYFSSRCWVDSCVHIYMIQESGVAPLAVRRSLNRFPPRGLSVWSLHVLHVCVSSSRVQIKFTSKRSYCIKVRFKFSSKKWMIPNFLRGVLIPSILTPQWFVPFSVDEQRGPACFGVTLKAKVNVAKRQR